jgi:hypothetical protein
MMPDNTPMTLAIEKHRQRLLELRLDVEKVQVYILENAGAAKLLAMQQLESVQQPRKQLELAVPQ